MITMELKFIFYFHIHVNSTFEDIEMYEDLVEMVPKIAISDHNTIKMLSYHAAKGASSTPQTCIPAVYI